MPNGNGKTSSSSSSSSSSRRTDNTNNTNRPPLPKPSSPRITRREFQSRTPQDQDVSLVSLRKLPPQNGPFFLLDVWLWAVQNMQNSSRGWQIPKLWWLVFFGLPDYDTLQCRKCTWITNPTPNFSASQTWPSNILSFLPMDTKLLVNMNVSSSFVIYNWVCLRNGAYLNECVHVSCFGTSDFEPRNVVPHFETQQKERPTATPRNKSPFSAHSLWNSDLQMCQKHRNKPCSISCPFTCQTRWFPAVNVVISS